MYLVRKHTCAHHTHIVYKHTCAHHTHIVYKHTCAHHTHIVYKHTCAHHTHIVKFPLALFLRGCIKATLFGPWLCICEHRSNSPGLLRKP